MKTSILHSTVIASVILLSSRFHTTPALADSCPSPSFAAARIFGPVNSPGTVAVADFNGDGKPDLAMATRGARNTDLGNVSVLLGNGDGIFQTAVNYGAGSRPTSVTVGDFNGDGKLDLAVANASSGIIINSGVSVLLGNGDGTFQTAVNYGAGSGPISVTVGDFNGDGKLDLAVANQGSASSGTIINSGVSVLLGNGDGTFQAAVNYGAGSGPIFVTMGDFNGDGKPDLAVANQGTGTINSGVSVLLGNGDGTFKPAVKYGAGIGPISVTVGDFNGDGKPDLAVANQGTVPVNSSVSVLLGNRDGTFQTAVNYGAGAGPSSSLQVIGAFSPNFRTTC